MKKKKMVKKIAKELSTIVTICQTVDRDIKKSEYKKLAAALLDTLTDEFGMLPPYVNKSGNKHLGQPFYSEDYYWEDEIDLNSMIEEDRELMEELAELEKWESENEDNNK